MFSHRFGLENAEELWNQDPDFPPTVWTDSKKYLKKHPTIKAAYDESQIKELKTKINKNTAEHYNLIFINTKNPNIVWAAILSFLLEFKKPALSSQMVTQLANLSMFFCILDLFIFNKINYHFYCRRHT